MAKPSSRKKASTRQRGGHRFPGMADEARLMVKAGAGARLSPAQLKFNTLMRRLEKARARYRRHQVSLDALLEECGRELLPLVAKLCRLNFELAIEGLAALKEVKLTSRRQKLLKQLIRLKANELLADPHGLTDGDLERLQHVVKELTDSQTEKSEKKALKDDLELMLDMFEFAAEEAGVNLDLSGLDMNADPAELEQEIQRRLEAAMHDPVNRPRPRRERKPSKAQQERVRRQQEAEEAKQRDLKSLYKQLAKVLHPDLESDHDRRLQKEEWMKRLTTAYAENDLRELLCIEMEWLGVEANNLAEASEQKLLTYARVLQEQIDDVNFKARSLLHQPQYAALHRFKHPFFDFIAPIPEQKAEMNKEIRHHQRLLETLRAGGPDRLSMLNVWAEKHDEQQRLNACPF